MSTSLLARCTFPPPGTSVICAFSGGADSTALIALASAAGCDVEAVHVDDIAAGGAGAEADADATHATVLDDVIGARRGDRRKGESALIAGAGVRHAQLI